MKKNKLKLTKRQRHNIVKLKLISDRYDGYVGMDEYTFEELWNIYKIDRIMKKAIFDLKPFDMNVSVSILRTELGTFKAHYKTFKYQDGEMYDTTADQGNLYYIADRWNAEFRVKWIIDLIERNEIYTFDDKEDEWIKSSVIGIVK
jgi:hypothetical protein